MIGNCVLLYTKRDLVRRRHLINSGDAAADAATAQRLLTALWTCRERGDARVFDVDELADTLELESDELNVQLAQLERVGTLIQGLDCSARGMVDVGFREPEDEDDCRFFREIFYKVHRARPNVRIQIDFQQLKDQHGYDPDTLEQKFIEWSLDRLITFSSSRRLRRVKLLKQTAPAESLARESARWRTWQHRRLQAMIDYATNESDCRRVIVGKHFGDGVDDCVSREIVKCDVCDGEPAPWTLLPDHLVADPETLINAELTLMQAVAWASSYRRGAYGETSLRAAVLGMESLGQGRPLGQGVLSCPQFGALKHVRNGEKRWNDALAQLMSKGMVDRRAVARDGSGATYQTLVLTTAGSQILGVPVSQHD
jgi:ATP-dependent DNA helicase RecQ